MLLKGIDRLIILGMLLASCKSVNDFDKKELLYRNTSKTDSTLRLELMHSGTDSIIKWINIKYKDVLYLDSSETNWEVDSFITFNTTRNRATGIILEQFFYSGSLDAIGFLDFEKRDNKWYVFLGATMYLPRNCYNKPNIQCKPIPMDRLRELGRRELLGIYYVKKWPWSSEYVINERWFREKMEISWSEQAKRDWISGKSRKRLIDTTKIPQ